MLAVTIYAHIPFGQSTRYTVEEKAWPVIFYPMFTENMPAKLQYLFKEQLYNCPTDTLWLLNYQSGPYNYPQATEAQTKVIWEVKNG